MTKCCVCQERDDETLVEDVGWVCEKCYREVEGKSKDEAYKYLIARTAKTEVEDDKLDNIIIFFLLIFSIIFVCIFYNLNESTVMGVLGISTGVMSLIIPVLLKYKRVRTGKVWKQLASVNVYTYFLVGTGYLLCGLHHLFTPNFTFLISLDNLGWTIMMVGFILQFIENKKRKQNPKLT